MVHDVERILAIELFTAAQALEFRKPAKTSTRLASFHAAFREQVPFVDVDTVMHDHMEAALAFVRPARCCENWFALAYRSKLEDFNAEEQRRGGRC